jgi:hypothetical protein
MHCYCRLREGAARTIARQLRSVTALSARTIPDRTIPDRTIPDKTIPDKTIPEMR